VEEMAVICEICGKPIENNLYIELFGEWTRRGTHKSCMRERITKAFAGCVGAEDDDVGELVYNVIEAAFEEVAPS
ncbi:MAG: hypothetical protein UHI93_00035, partial [Acutalibacteraceae bacterium]|nr:hypothetical protein [Acutalibacteraceae bacterium]